MYDYTGVKNIDDLNLIYQPKDYFNPHKNQYEFKTETDFVEILPDFIGYANGDVCVKVRKGTPIEEYKIRFSRYLSVWVDDYNDFSFISQSIAMVKDYLCFDSKEWILFLNALRDCNNYVDSGLAVETLLPPKTEKSVHRVNDRVVSHYFSPLNGWFNVKYNYTYCYSETTVYYSVFDVNDMKVVLNQNTLSIDIYADRDKVGIKTKELFEKLLFGKVSRFNYHPFLNFVKSVSTACL